MTARRRSRFRHATSCPSRLIDSDYFIAKNGYIAPSSQKFYNNDRLNPYAYGEGDKFYWIRPGAVGGKSLIWGRWSFRWSPEDFEANKKENVGIDWPIRYDDLAPWYDYVEKPWSASRDRAKTCPSCPTACSSRRCR
jgi:choline dehydrogenase-like flavoprotein